MVEGGRSCEPFCGYVLRIIMITLVFTGVVLSFLASNTCHFLYFQPGTSTESDAASDEGWIGIFKYNTIANETQEVLSSECFVYEILLDPNENKALFASQLCSIMAPCVAMIAIALATTELICCEFFGSFMAMSVLFLTASLLQCGSFGIFLIESDLCFDSDGCTIGTAAYYSASAVIAFWTSCIILCCSPRSHPCMQIGEQISQDNYSMDTPAPKVTSAERENA